MRKNEINLIFDWQFALGDVGLDAAIAGSADFRPVQIPHDWSLDYPFAQDAVTGGSGGSVETGIGWYRLPLNIKRTAARIYLRFEGVYMDSVVYLNGQQVGSHYYGYTPFTLDVTDAVCDGENILCVRVNNGDQPNSRWYSGSGITRPVKLFCLDNLHISEYGVYVETVSADQNRAELRVTTDVENHGTAQSVTVVAKLYDADGKPQNVYGRGRSLLVDGHGQIQQTIGVPLPHRWFVEDPYLYRLVVQLYDGAKMLDEVTVPVGIRTIEWSALEGMKLNGVKIKLLGGCVHHDGGGVGAAVPRELWERRLKILKSAGMNAIRMSHNPPDVALLDLCDELGLLVMDEAFDEWSIPKDTKTFMNGEKVSRGYGEHFYENYHEDLVTMLKRDRNHPSIVIWSIGNEVPDQLQEDGWKLVKEMKDICHAYDSRPVTVGCDWIAAEPLGAYDSFLEELDVVGYNYVDRWKNRAATMYTEDRLKHPEWLQIGTESSGISGGVRGRYNLSLDRSIRRGIPYWYGYTGVERLIKYFMSHDFVAGDFMWTAIDYLGESFWPRVVATFGIIDTCGFEKDGYWFYRSIWKRDEPMAYLLPHWNLDVEPGTILPVIGFTSCQEAELFVNGKSYGRKAYRFPAWGQDVGSGFGPAGMMATTDDLHLTWDVAYEPGTIELVGYNNSEEVCRYVRKTTGAAVRLEAKAYSMEPMEANGTDILQIEINALDSEGNFVPTANLPVTVSVEGAGKLVSLDNGNPSDLSGYHNAEKQLFNGKAFAIVRAARTPGICKVTVSAEGLDAAEIKVEVI